MLRKEEKGSVSVALFGELLVDELPDRCVMGGAPFNVAYHLRRFGLDPVLITRVGEDAEGEQLLTALENWGLDTRGVQRDPGHPGVVAKVSSNQPTNHLS